MKFTPLTKFNIQEFFMNSLVLTKKCLSPLLVFPFWRNHAIFKRCNRILLSIRDFVYVSTCIKIVQWNIM